MEDRKASFHHGSFQGGLTVVFPESCQPSTVLSLTSALPDLIIYALDDQETWSPGESYMSQEDDCGILFLMVCFCLSVEFFFL